MADDLWGNAFSQIPGVLTDPLQDRRAMAQASLRRARQRPSQDIMALKQKAAEAASAPQRAVEYAFQQASAQPLGMARTGGGVIPINYFNEDTQKAFAESVGGARPGIPMQNLDEFQQRTMWKAIPPEQYEAAMRYMGQVPDWMYKEAGREVPKREGSVEFGLPTIISHSK